MSASNCHFLLHQHKLLFGYFIHTLLNHSVNVINVPNIIEDTLTQFRIFNRRIFILNATILSSIDPGTTVCIFTLLFNQTIDALLKLFECSSSGCSLDYLCIIGAIWPLTCSAVPVCFGTFNSSIMICFGRKFQQ